MNRNLKNIHVIGLFEFGADRIILTQHDYEMHLSEFELVVLLASHKKTQTFGKYVLAIDAFNDMVLQYLVGMNKNKGPEKIASLVG